MAWVGPVEWVKSLRYRPRFLGWFIASVCFFLLANTWFLIVLALMSIGIAPTNLGLLVFGLSLVSLSAMVYSLTRMMAPTETLPDAIDANRRKIIWALFGLFFLMAIILNTLTRIFGVSIQALTPLAPLLMVIVYGIPISTGYDAARLKNTEESIGLETEPLPLPTMLVGKSKKKTAIAVIGLLTVVVVVGVVISPISGITTAASISGMVWFIAWLYPDEDLEEYRDRP